VALKTVVAFVKMVLAAFVVAVPVLNDVHFRLIIDPASSLSLAYSVFWAQGKDKPRVELNSHF